jgi:hypothetical protein
MQVLKSAVSMESSSNYYKYWGMSRENGKFIKKCDMPSLAGNRALC